MALTVLALFVVLVILVATFERAQGRRAVAGRLERQFQDHDWAMIAVCTLVGLLATWLVQDRLLQSDWRQVRSKTAAGMMPEMIADEEFSLRARTAAAAVLGGVMGGGTAVIGLRLVVARRSRRGTPVRPSGTG